jgi:hypothetical protein
LTPRGAHHAAIWYDQECQHRDQNQEETHAHLAIV